MSERSSSRAHRGRASSSGLWIPGLAVVFTLVVIGALWWIAVPSGPEVCAAISPAPRNCFAADRAAAAVVATIVLSLLAVGTVIAAVVTRRFRPQLVSAGVAVLILAAAVSWVLVAWIPSLA